MIQDRIIPVLSKKIKYCSYEDITFCSFGVDTVGLVSGLTKVFDHLVVIACLTKCAVSSTNSKNETAEIPIQNAALPPTMPQKSATYNNTYIKRINFGSVDEDLDQAIWAFCS